MTDDTTFTTERPARTRRFTDKAIATWADFKPGLKRKVVPVPGKLGHFIVVQPSGVRSFVVQARDAISRKQVWTVVGRCDRMKIETAATEGDKIIARIKQGKPPVEPPVPPAATVKAMFSDWVKLHVVKNGLRSRREIERKIARYVLPRIGDRIFVELRRTDIVKLLDQVAEDHGARQADAVYTVLLSAARWHASRSDYIVAFDGIRKHSTAKSRDRTLDHDEIRTLWTAAEHPAAGQMGAIIRLCLLLGQRKAKVATMKFSDIGTAEIDVVEESREADGSIVKKIKKQTFDGCWCIPQAPREKDAGGALILPRAALDIIEAQPRFAGNDHVFPSRSVTGHVHAGMFSLKESFDKLLPDGFEPYRLHDLRRTARSLMSGAKINRDDSERVLGHRVAGKVEGIYDRYAYLVEKGEALKKLADYIAIILAGPADDGKVVPLRPAS